MSDLIDRQDVQRIIEDVWTEFGIDTTDQFRDELQERLVALPSAPTDIHYRKMGEWDMFELITSTWYGKQYYFMQDDEIVYSRASGKYMSVDKAINEFLSAIGDN